MTALLILAAAIGSGYLASKVVTPLLIFAMRRLHSAARPIRLPEARVCGSLIRFSLPQPMSHSAIGQAAVAAALIVSVINLDISPKPSAFHIQIDG